MIALFVNGSTEPQCGVNQFGKNLYAVLGESNRINWCYCEAQTKEWFESAVNALAPDFILYNWQAGQGGILSGAPFQGDAKQCLVYHDLAVNEEKWDAIFFADQTIQSHGKWHVIGRPLPAKSSRLFKPMDGVYHPVVGVHGFIGAWADQVVWRVMQEFEIATIRLSLPFAKYGDADGKMATAMAERCMTMVSNNSGIGLEISHEFMPAEALTEWLSSNDLNCYIRPCDMQWRGVSSAPDFALAANRPFAVNRCSAFRHLHNLSPSICIEDSSLTDIFANGLSPFIDFKNKWCDPQIIRNQIEDVLERL